VSPDPADTAAPARQPSLRRERRGRVWMLLTVTFYIIAGYLLTSMLIAALFLDAATSSMLLPLLSFGAFVALLAGQAISLPGKVRSRLGWPTKGWISRLVVPCVYATLLGLVGVFLVSLLSPLGVAPDHLTSRAFDVWALVFALACASFALGFIFLVALSIASGVRRALEMRVR
jgi:hypothetical protein